MSIEIEAIKLAQQRILMNQCEYMHACTIRVNSNNKWHGKCHSRRKF